MLEKLFIRGKDYRSSIKKTFDLMAPFYDWLEPFIGSLRPKAIEISEVTSHDRVVDFCTGPGSLALKLAEITPHVVGVDLSYGMLRVARRKDEDEEVKFIQANAAETPFRDNEFDISYISMALHDMPQLVRKKVLEEMKRVTKRKIVIVDYHIPKNLIHRWIHIVLISTYESKYFRDFANPGIKRLLEQSNLRIVRESPGHLFKIYACELKYKAHTGRPDTVRFGKEVLQNV